MRTTTLCAVFVLSPFVFAQSLLREIDGGAAFPLEFRFGQSIADAGDVDGDGVPDLFVSSDSQFQLGRARVFSGSTGAVIHTFVGEDHNAFGWQVSGAGDVNGDGFDDLIAGEMFHGRPSVGQALVYSGRDGSVLYDFAGTANSQFGASVSSAGDVNADGFDDVVVGARFHDSEGGNRNGRGMARVLSGRDGALLYQFEGAIRGDFFGSFVEGVGDVNGDGRDDLAIMVPRASLPAAGTVQVFSGDNGSLLYELAVESGTDPHDFAAAGDLNGDGFDDILVLQRTSQVPVVRALVFAFSGVDGSLLFSIDAPSIPYSVASAGDVDGDNRPDIIAGAQFQAFVFSGVDGRLLRSLRSTEASFGFEVTSAGDVDRDGLDDVAVAAPNSDKVFVYDLGFTRQPGIESVHGAGCPGSNGHLPRIEVEAGGADLGASLRVGLRGARPSWVAVLYVGTPTEISLAPLGMQLCTLFNQPFASVGASTNPIGRASLEFTVPNDAGAVGLEIEMQWIGWDPQVAPLGVALSDGLTVRIGE